MRCTWESFVRGKRCRPIYERPHVDFASINYQRNVIMIFFSPLLFSIFFSRPISASERFTPRMCVITDSTGCLLVVSRVMNSTWKLYALNNVSSCEVEIMSRSNVIVPGNLRIPSQRKLKVAMKILHINSRWKSTAPESSPE